MGVDHLSPIRGTSGTQRRDLRIPAVLSLPDDRRRNVDFPFSRPL